MIRVSPPVDIGDEGDLARGADASIDVPIMFPAATFEHAVPVDEVHLGGRGEEHTLHG